MAEPGSGGREGRPPRRLDRTARFVALAGGVVMLATAILVCVSVTLRWAGSQAVPGDFEWVQIGVAIAAFSFLPLCQLRGGNIIVTTFTARLSRNAQHRLDSLWDLVYAAAALIIAWRLGVGAYEAFRSQSTTMVVGFPIGWSIAVSALLVLLLAAAALVTAIRPRRPGV